MNVVGLIREAAAASRTRFAFELLPPLKGEGREVVYDAIDPLAEFDPAYINVTFHREGLRRTVRADGSVEEHVGRHRPGTVGISAAIRHRYGVETVPHIICGGLSRYDIEDALIDMDFLGLHNVLALRGDKSKSEERFTPHPQGHAHAADLVRQIAAMNRGEYVDGGAAGHRTRFSIGVAGYPEKHLDAPDADEDLRRLREKTEAGADYIVTQMFFDNGRYFDFVRRCRAAGIDRPIIPGIKPLAALRHLEGLPALFGITIPDELRREALAYPDRIREVGIEWATAQALELKRAGVPVIHFYTMGRTDNIRRIAQKVF